MFYFLSKTLDLLVAPLSWVLVLSLTPAWAARRYPALARRAPLAAALILYFFSTPRVAAALARSLESTATTTVSPTETYDVVVVLGGMLNASTTQASPEYSEPVDRLLAAYDLLRCNRARNILITSDAEEAGVVAKQLADWGISPDRIVVDAQSRNTRDNAMQSARIIHDHAWSHVLLVTSALHMPRAAGCFRAVGLSFDTLAVDHLATAPGGSALRLAPRADALFLSTVVLREATGHVVYRVLGYAR